MTQQATLNARGTALASNVEYLDKGNLRPLWLSSDGRKIYCSTGKGLYISTNDMTTAAGPYWTLPVTGTNTEIHAIRETADGEILVSAFKLQGNYAGLWRSTGIASPGTVTFTEVLTPSGQAPWAADPATFPSPAGATGDRSNYFSGWFGFHAYGDGRVIVNEYGKQANGTTVAGARYVFVSSDNGKAGTWSLARDMWAGPPMTTVGNTLAFGSATWHDHMHGAIIDPFTGLCWYTCGDNGQHTEYADTASLNWPDPGNAHGTWSTTAGSQTQYGGTGGQAGSTQCVTPWAFPQRILMTTDGQLDGVVGYEKASVGRLDAKHGIGLPHTSALHYTGATPYQRDILSHSPTYQPQYPILFPFYVGSGGVGAMPAMIVASDPLGQRFYDVWTDDQSVANPYGCFNALGPTEAGKLIATVNGDGRAAGQAPSSYQNMTVLRADFPVIT